MSRFAVNTDRVLDLDRIRLSRRVDSRTRGTVLHVIRNLRVLGAKRYNTGHLAPAVVHGFLRERTGCHDAGDT